MVAQAAFPLVNGLRHSWASIEINLNGAIFYGTGVNWSRKRARTLVRVNHPDPVGKTRGNNEYTGDVELLLAEANLFQSQLIAAANQQNLNGGYGDVFFSVLVQFTELGLDTVTVQLLGCTADSWEQSNAESTEGSKVKMELSPLKVLINGQDDLPNPLQAPQ
jgi:hypothetical protein